MVGSSFAQGDQMLQLWKSLMRGAILSGVALMETERSTMKVEGFIAARMRMTQIATTARMPMDFSMRISLHQAEGRTATSLAILRLGFGGDDFDLYEEFGAGKLGYDEKL